VFIIVLWDTGTFPFTFQYSDVLFSQSMNFICAMLLLFMDEEDAFWLLCCVVEELTFFDGVYYYQADLAGVRIDQYVFSYLVEETLPKCHQRLQQLNVAIEPLTINWFLCLFVNSVPLETTLRIWDAFFLEGTRTLFRAGLALLKVNEKLILKAQTSEQLMTFLKAFTRSALDCDHFARICFDSFSVGSVPYRQIFQLRTRFRLEVCNPNPSNVSLSHQISSPRGEAESWDQSRVDDGLKIKLEEEPKEDLQSQASWPMITPFGESDRGGNALDNSVEHPNSGQMVHVDSKYADRFFPLSFHITSLSKFHSSHSTSKLSVGNSPKGIPTYLEADEVKADAEDQEGVAVSNQSTPNSVLQELGSSLPNFSKRSDGDNNELLGSSGTNFSPPIRRPAARSEIYVPNLIAKLVQRHNAKVNKALEVESEQKE
jgi:hypothetical protein